MSEGRKSWEKPLFLLVSFLTSLPQSDFLFFPPSSLILRETCLLERTWLLQWGAGHIFSSGTFFCIVISLLELYTWGSSCGLAREVCHYVQHCFYGKMLCDFTWIYLHSNFWITTFPLVGRLPLYDLHSGFYSLLICKWTIRHFFVEGPEPEVFPSEIINYYIKMNFIHPTNMAVYFKWYFIEFLAHTGLWTKDWHVNKIGTLSW